MSEIKLDDIKDQLHEAESAVESLFFSPPEETEVHQRRLAHALEAVMKAAGLRVSAKGIELLRLGPVEGVADVVPVTLKTGAFPHTVFRKNLRFKDLPHAGDAVHFDGWEGLFIVDHVGWFTLDDESDVVRPRVVLVAKTLMSESFEQLKKEGWM
jgi:hypothetical protein